ncbi:MAG: nucleotidyltransferase domain-containing protein [Solimonas sp.]
MQDDAKSQLYHALCAAVLKALPDAWAIYAFGSFANDQERADSDIDIAILLPPGAKLTNLLELKSDLATIARREVDVADLRSAGNPLHKQVLTSGKLLYSASQM